MPGPDTPVAATPPGTDLTRRDIRRLEAEAAARAEFEAALPAVPPADAAAAAEPAAADVAGRTADAFPGVRRSPSGRIPQWAIDEAAGRPATDTAWRTTGTAPAPQAWETVVAAAPQKPRGSAGKAVRRCAGIAAACVRGAWRLTQFITLMVLGIAIVWFGATKIAPDLTTDLARRIAPLVKQIPGLEVPPAFNIPDLSPAPGRPSWPVEGHPPPGLESAGHPLGQAAPLAAANNSYAFMRAGTGEVHLAYDPCRPIHYVTRGDNAPPGGDRLIAEALAEASRASGFVFINDGPTAEVPVPGRDSYQPERYGDRWAPVLFSWQNRVEEPQFTNDWMPGKYNVLGIGGSTSMTLEGKPSAYVSGQVRLNAAALTGMAAEHGGHDKVRGVIAHEIAHVLGLDHVNDNSQLMAATASDQVTTFQDGDLTGLAILGSGGCRDHF